MNQIWKILSLAFILVVALQTKLLLSRKLLKNSGSMPEMSTLWHVCQP